jgi:enolase
MDKKIKSVKAREILDSRGHPTLEVKVFAGEVSGIFSVPSGASTGRHEAVAIGVKSAIGNVHNKILPAIKGLEIDNQKKIDEAMIELDGTENKSSLGANAIVGVSLACARAAAALFKQELYEYLRDLEAIRPPARTPLLFMNLVNGGEHSKSPLAFQEYHIVPQTEDVREALEIGTRIKFDLRKKLIQELGRASANYGDEGGFAPDTADIKLPLRLLSEVIAANRLTAKVKLALDVAASSFYENGEYEAAGKRMNFGGLLGLYKEIIGEFNVFSIEDPFEEEDFAGFGKLLKVGTGTYLKYVVGDDLTVTNKLRLQTAINQKSINAIIIKPNQIGTLSEALETMRLARENKIECIVSHRSGETNDDFIADLAFAFGALGLKAGAPERGERIAKYNRLVQISIQ